MSETCMVGACEREATVPMVLHSTVAGEREGVFCEPCAKHFEGTWERVDQAPVRAPDDQQLQLGI